MRYRLRWVPKTQRDIAWTRIQSWGYPYPTDQYDAMCMVEIAPARGYYWMEWLSDTDALLHIAARTRVLTRRLCKAIEVTAELCGVHTLWVITDIDVVNDYARRYGFTETKDGWYLEVPHGQSQESVEEGGVPLH